jgi:uncharacterized protein (DUF983 family)
MSGRPTLFARALLLRCPRCAAGGVVRRWFMVADDCPSCGLSLVGGGNRVGSYVYNLVVAELCTVALVVGIVWARRPDVPWDLLGWLAPMLAITLPLAFYPFSRLLFVATDLAMHPRMRRDEDT